MHVCFFSGRKFHYLIFKPKMQKLKLILCFTSLNFQDPLANFIYLKFVGGRSFRFFFSSTSTTFDLNPFTAILDLSVKFGNKEQHIFSKRSNGFHSCFATEKNRCLLSTLAIPINAMLKNFFQLHRVEQAGWELDCSNGLVPGVL